MSGPRSIGRICARARAELLGRTDRRALATEPDDPGVPYKVARSYPLLGRPEETLDCIDKAIDLGFGFKQWIAHDSDLDAIRNNPRFAALLKRL